MALLGAELAEQAWAPGRVGLAFSFQGELFFRGFGPVGEKCLDVCFGGLGFWGWTGGEGGRMKWEIKPKGCVHSLSGFSN